MGIIYAYIRHVITEFCKRYIVNIIPDYSFNRLIYIYIFYTIIYAYECTVFTTVPTFIEFEYNIFFF
jgi:hypothetical protein